MTEYVSVDIDEIAKVQEQFGKRVRIPTIRVNAGEERELRIIKAPTDRRFFIVRVHHWNIPIGMTRTPPQACSYKHFGRKCYFCEAVNEYYNSGDPRKADLARKMKATIGYTSNVIDVNDPLTEDGLPKVQLWQYSESVFKELMYYVKNKDEYGDIFHPEEGRDIRLQSEIVGGTSGTTYTKHKIKIRGKASPVFDVAVFDYIYDLEKERPLKEFTYEQQIGIFDGTFDYRTGESKSLGGNEFGIPKLMGSEAEEFESVKDNGSMKPPVVEDSEEEFIEAPPQESEPSKAVEASSDEDEDEWDSVLSEDGAEDEKVADIKAKLKSALNKKKKRG